MSAHVYLPREWSQGSRKIGMFEVLLCRETLTTFNLGLNAAKNAHHTKKDSNKICLKLNFVQKIL